VDGWNELDSNSRRRAAAEIRELQRNFPQLGVIIATQRQALDVPIRGQAVEIDILRADQQLEIACAASTAKYCKEEVLRLFVHQHEAGEKAAALHDALLIFTRKYCRRLAAEATQRANNE
jgi:hypothetical protein